MSEALTKDMFITKVFDYENNKDWKFSGELPAVVDSWAPGCGPCKMVGPIIEELSEEMKGQVHFYRVNTDVEQELASVFGIRSIPSLSFIPKEGKPIMAADALPKNELSKIINENLLNKETWIWTETQTDIPPLSMISIR